MPVAKSYIGLKQLTEPYEKNNKMYIVVELKSGKSKEVRWYSNSEFNKLYPEVEIKDPYKKSQKEVLGFEKGFITIFKGVKPEHEEWFINSACCFAKWWGWYLPSYVELPEDLPLGVQPVELPWEGMGNERDWLKDEATVKSCVSAALSTPQVDSKPQGKIGDRIERTLTVQEVTSVENKFYGSRTNTHLMSDPDGNLYLWKTAAKDWASGTVKRVRGTIKEYQNNITVLTRCMEV